MLLQIKSIYHQSQKVVVPQRLFCFLELKNNAHKLKFLTTFVRNQAELISWRTIL